MMGDTLSHPFSDPFFFGNSFIFFDTYMGLVDTLTEELKSAMKNGETDRRDVIRLLQSALKNVAIEWRKPAAELSDDEVQGVVRRLVKQRKDSIEQYRAGGREDLAANEEKEVNILADFLPAEMPEAELRQLVTEAITESGVTTRKEMGKVMGVAMKKVAGRASGDAVRAMVMQVLPETE